MGEWTEADKTSMVMPIAGLISGLTVISGGIAGIVLGIQANEREDGNGQTAFAAGITAIIAGAATATGGIIAICRKISEVMDRDDGGPGNNVALGSTSQALSQLSIDVDTDANKLQRTSV